MFYEGFLYINPTTGEIKTSKRLTGKGRPDPYEMKIRAEDNGEPGMFTDVKLSLYISDIIENDGVPSFVHPTADEIAYVSEVKWYCDNNLHERISKFRLCF